MFTYRGRGGPSRSTPANVTCQKCLKKDEWHYSYECKASTQERPYKSRPSRSQQLRNPKLVPDLTNEKPDPLETKKGAADAELAKKESERARKRELEERDDRLVDSVVKRRRSVSSESVSTISTRSSKSPPARRRGSISPEQHHEYPAGNASRGRTRSRSDASRSLTRSMSPLQRGGNQKRDRRAPPPQDLQWDRNSVPVSSRDQPEEAQRSRRPYGSSVSQSPSPRKEASRSPVRATERRRDRAEKPGRRHDDDRSQRGRYGRGGQPDARPPPREQSLSPFSKRLALTKSRN